MPEVYICKELVMPKCEALFAMDTHYLEQGSGTFDLLGQTGRALLRANIAQDPATGLSTASISMKPAKSPVLGSILSSGPFVNPPAMAVKGAGGKEFGVLRAEGNQTFSMIANGKDVMRLAFEQQSGLLTMTAMNGTFMAVASPNNEASGPFTNQELLMIRVGPGVDAVLVLLCVIGVVVFGSHLEKI